MKKLLSAVCMIAACAAFADTTPVMLSLFDPVQVPSSEYDVTGFRLSLLYGDCANFKGLDIGIVDHTDGDFAGLQIGGVNVVDEKFRGGQIGLVNWNGNEVREWDRQSIGLQWGILNYADTFCGLQDGIVNVSGSRFTGLQSALFNMAQDVNGVQCGAYLFLGVNVASGAVNGCQFGLVNYAHEMVSGVQIGLINVIAHNGFLPVCPIVNGRF